MKIEKVGTRFRIGSEEKSVPKTIAGYGKFLGILLSCFGFVVAIKDDSGRTFYFNRKSAIKALKQAQLTVTDKAKKQEIIGLFKKYCAIPKGEPRAKPPEQLV